MLTKEFESGIKINELRREMSRKSRGEARGREGVGGKGKGKEEVEEAKGKGITLNNTLKHIFNCWLAIGKIRVSFKS